MCAIVNPATGETVEFVSETPELLVMENVWNRADHRTVEHVHPGMEERWHVLEGTAGFRIGGEETLRGPSDSVVAPPGVPHLGWNAGGGVVRLRIEMRPALRWREFVERLFANGGTPEPDLLAEFGREVGPP
ncbi:MAG TPA: cupin domain-containing protein [Solirubrobacteraceae bacterium]